MLSVFNTDPNRTVDEILADIQRGAVSAASSGNINLVGHVLAPFAALLVKLSRDSSAATARVQRLTRNLFATVIALLIVTFVLFAREVNNLYEKNYRNQAANISEQMMKHLVSDSAASRE
jgi:hypothetical protein